MIWTLDTELRIPEHVAFTFIQEEAVLLNTRNNKYYSITEVGARLWQLLKESMPLRVAFSALLSEYDVDPPRLEQDLLQLLQDLQKNGLVEPKSLCRS